MSMDVRKAQATSKPAQEKGKVFSGFGELKGEFKKISWTSREELKAYTKIVVVATLVSGIAIYVADLLIRGTLGGIGSLLRVIIS